MTLNSMGFIILIPVLLGVLCNLYKKKRWIWIIGILTQIILVAILISLKGTHFIWGGYSSKLGIEFEILNVDRYAMILFSILIGVCIIQEKAGIGKDGFFLFLILSLEGILFGIIASKDLFTTFLLTELSTIISTVLIIYKKDKKSFREGLYYILYNAFGMLLFLIGIVILYSLYGSVNMNNIQEHILRENVKTVLIQGHVAYVLLITAISLKSAMFPLYNWLPRAHGTALSPISGLLSGIIIVIGPYNLIKIQKIYSNLVGNELLQVIGFITCISAGFFAIIQTKPKRLLAFSTSSQMGFIVWAIGLSNGIYGNIIFILVVHGVLKFFMFTNYKNKLAKRVLTLVFSGIPMSLMFFLKYGIEKNIEYYLMLMITLAYSVIFWKMQEEENIELSFLMKISISIIGISNIYIIVLKAMEVFKLELLIYIPIIIIVMISLELIKRVEFTKKLKNFDIPFTYSNILILVFMLTILWNIEFILN